MGVRIENDCVSCERCVNCGRREIEVHFCDKCDEYADMWNPLYVTDNGEELCWECYKAQYTEKICDDMDEEHCNLCNSDAEYLYLVDGSWICEQCLKSIADRVDMEV